MEREQKQRSSSVRQRKINRRRKKLIIYTTIFILSIIALWSVYGDRVVLVNFGTKEYKMAETNYKIDLGRENRNTFFSLSKGDFYHLTRDKITLYDRALNRKWEYIHDFINIDSHQSEDRLIVFDVGSRKNISVYNKSGVMYTIMPSFNVKSAKINDKGYSVVISSEEGIYYTDVYDNLGNIILSRIDNDEVVLLDYDISNDNRYLVYSYLDLTAMDIKSNVSFQYLNEEDSIMNNNSNGIFSWHTKENELVGRVSCIGDYTYVISDKSLQSFSVGRNTVNTEMLLNFTNIIDDIVFIGNKYFAISMGPEDMNQESYLENSVIIYDEKGTVIRTLNFNKSPIFIKEGINSILINIDNTVINYNLNGNERWKLENDMLINDIILLGSNDRALVIDNKEAVIVNKEGIIDNKEEVVVTDDLNTQVE